MRPEPSVSHVFLARQIPSDDPNIDQNTVFFDVFEGKRLVGVSPISRNAPSGNRLPLRYCEPLMERDMFDKSHHCLGVRY